MHAVCMPHLISPAKHLHVRLLLSHECWLQAKKGRQVLAFYTMPEYEAWCERTNTQGWAIKYYKGLGTSDAKEAKEYFADIDDHRKTFVWNGEGPTHAYCCT